MEEAPIAIIKPNVKKQFILNLLFVFGVVSLIVVMIVYFETTVGFDVLFGSFEAIGVSLSPGRPITYAIFLTIIFGSIFLILNYLTLSKIHYTLYKDKLVYAKSMFFAHIPDLEIPFSNISKVTFQKKALNTGTITIELTGMKEPKVEMKFIDNPEEVVNRIHQLIQEYRARYYAKYTQEYKIQNIMEDL